MRLLGILYLFFLVQGDVGTYGVEVEPTADGSAYLSRRKRGWSWSASATKKVTKRPIGWTVGARPSSQQAVQKPYPTQQSHYVPPQQSHYVPTQQIYYPQVQQPYRGGSVSFTRPTKSLTSQLVKAAVVVGVAGAVSAYAKPVRPSTKSPAQREEERERRRQQRLSRRSTTTTEIAPTTVDVGNSTIATSTTTPVPLAASELIPVVVPDANNLLQIVYVRRDQIPPGGMPIAVQMPLPSVATTPMPSATTQQATPAVPKA